MISPTTALKSILTASTFSFLITLSPVMANCPKISPEEADLFFSHKLADFTDGKTVWKVHITKPLETYLLKRDGVSHPLSSKNSSISTRSTSNQNNCQYSAIANYTTERGAHPLLGEFTLTPLKKK